MDYLIAILLGIVEGVTEFLPVSSTGHLLLLTHFLKFGTTGMTFEVLIQLGAVLALLTLYFQRLWTVVVTLPSQPSSRAFVASVLIAFLPAMVLGVLLHDFIKGILFETPQVICISLIVGGIALWAVDKYAPTPKHEDAMALDWKTSLTIGLFQCLAMIPGMSRSGSTLIGAMLCKVDKKSAAEFSFFLAMPTMAGAFAYDVFKSYKDMDFSDVWLIGLGFASAFITAVLVVKALLAYVSRHGYAVFAVWRVCVGVVGLILLQMGF